jgi:hypothetical protein
MRSGPADGVALGEPDQVEEGRDPAALLGMGQWGPNVRAAWGAFWASRLAVFGVVVWITLADVVINAAPESEFLAHPFEAWPATGLLDVVFSPLAKWDAQHYLAIAFDGYTGTHSGLPAAEMRAAFFPLYPMTVRALSGFGASPGLVLIMAYVVALACFFGALVLIHRLAVIELGERYARPALMLLAFFPTSFFFGIPYTESMFLLVAAGAFFAARMGYWPAAGVILALASATRVPGLLLVIPVALFYLYGPRADRDPDSSRGGPWPRYRVKLDATWLLFAPLGLIAFSIYMHFALGDALAWQQAQELFGRQTIDPLSGLWGGLREAWTSAGQIIRGTYDQQPINDHLSISQLAFVVFALAGGIGLLRMLPPAYGAWVLVSLVPIFVSQPPDLPFWSASRFIAVLFPIFFWLAVVCERRRVTTTVVALFAAGMAVFAAEFALWSFVA